MNIKDLKAGDVVVSVGENDATYYQIMKVNRITVRAMCENGTIVNRVYPSVFSRKPREDQIDPKVLNRLAHYVNLHNRSR